MRQLQNTYVAQLAMNLRSTLRLRGLVLCVVCMYAAERTRHTHYISSQTVLWLDW